MHHVKIQEFFNQSDFIQIFVNSETLHKVSLTLAYYYISCSIITYDGEGQKYSELFFNKNSTPENY